MLAFALYKSKESTDFDLRAFTNNRTNIVVINIMSQQELFNESEGCSIELIEN